MQFIKIVWEVSSFIFFPDPFRRSGHFAEMGMVEKKSWGLGEEDSNQEDDLSFGDRDNDQEVDMHLEGKDNDQAFENIWGAASLINESTNTSDEGFDWSFADENRPEETNRDESFCEAAEEIWWLESFSNDTTRNKEKVMEEDKRRKYEDEWNSL